MRKAFNDVLIKAETKTNKSTEIKPYIENNMIVMPNFNDPIAAAMTLHSFQCIGYIPKIIRWILEGKERNLKVSLENLLSTIEQLKEESKDFYDYMEL
jgi:hypothetical protein